MPTSGIWGNLAAKVPISNEFLVEIGRRFLLPASRMRWRIALSSLALLTLFTSTTFILFGIFMTVMPLCMGFRTFLLYDFVLPLSLPIESPWYLSFVRSYAMVKPFSLATGQLWSPSYFSFFWSEKNKFVNFSTTFDSLWNIQNSVLKIHSISRQDRLSPFFSKYLLQIIHHCFSVTLLYLTCLSDSL